MEKRLQTVAEMLEIGLNFLPVICLETMVCAVFKQADAPFLFSCLPICLPFLFYAARRGMEKSLLLFLGVHLAAAAGLVWVAGRFPMPALWQTVYLALAVGYGVRSLRIRVTSATDGEGEIGPMGAAFFALTAFFVCSYVHSQTGCGRIVRLCFVWIGGYLVKLYLIHFIRYLALNRNSAGTIPQKSIFGMGMVAVGGYGCFSVLTLILCTRTALIPMLTELVKSGLLALLRGIVRLLSLFGKEQAPETVLEAGQPAAQEALLMADAAETPLWVRITEQILMAAVLLFVLAGAAALFVGLLRLILQGFYGRQREKKKIVSQEYLEEQQRLEGDRRTRKRRLPPVGGTPAQRVRRAFQRAVRRSMAPGTAGSREKTARELTAAFRPDGGWDALLGLYERARYSDAVISREEARAADKLSRQIAHTIK